MPLWGNPAEQICQIVGLTLAWIRTLNWKGPTRHTHTPAMYYLVIVIVRESLVLGTDTNALVLFLATCRSIFYSGR